MSEPFKPGSKVKYPEGSGTLYEVVASTDMHSWIKSPKNPVGYVEGNGFLVDASPKWKVGVTYRHNVSGSTYRVVGLDEFGKATVEYTKTGEVHLSQRQFYTEVEKDV
jgi:hypothetical protein